MTGKFVQIAIFTINLYYILGKIMPELLPSNSIKVLVVIPDSEL